MTSRTLARQIAEFMHSKKGLDVVIIDLRKVTSTTDYFVICTGESDTHVRGIADAVQDGTAQIGSPVWKYEGYHALQWVLLDFVDVVAHVFYKEARPFYNLERLWGDATVTSVLDEADDDVPVKKTKPRTRKAPAKKKAAVDKKAEIE